MGRPARSSKPLRTTRYSVSARSSPFGMSVTALDPVFHAKVAGAETPPDWSVKPPGMENSFTRLENVTVIVEFRGTARLFGPAPTIETGGETESPVRIKDTHLRLPD